MARFSHLILPGQIWPLPQGYGQIISLFDENSDISAKKHLVKFIDFIDSKIDQELEENWIKDNILYAVEINKMIVKNDCRKSAERKLIELKEAVNKFNNLLNKRAREGFPSCWGLGGSIL